MAQLLQPSLPLSPMLRCELARQFEFAVSDTLSDRPSLIPLFFTAITAQLDAIAAGICDERAAGGVAISGRTPSPWQELLAFTPAGVDPAVWAGLFEFFSLKVIHILGPQQLLPFVQDALDPARFARLERIRSS